jgi:hypothetical protein
VPKLLTIYLVDFSNEQKRQISPMKVDMIKNPIAFASPAKEI